MVSSSKFIVKNDTTSLNRQDFIYIVVIFKFGFCTVTSSSSGLNPDFSQANFDCNIYVQQFLKVI